MPEMEVRGSPADCKSCGSYKFGTLELKVCKV